MNKVNDCCEGCLQMLVVGCLCGICEPRKEIPTCKNAACECHKELAGINSSNT